MPFQANLKNWAGIGKLALPVNKVFRPWVALPSGKRESVAVFRRIDDPRTPSPRIEMEQVEIDREDALESEQRAFIDCVRTRRAPLVSGEDALRALRTALRVIEAMPPVDDLS